MKGTIIRPILMVLFVLLMVFLFQKELEEREAYNKQLTKTDPNSVIYADIELIDGIFPDDELKGEKTNDIKEAQKKNTEVSNK